MDKGFILAGRPCVFMYDSRRGKRPIAYRYTDTGDTYRTNREWLAKNGVQVPYNLPSKAEHRSLTKRKAYARGFVHPIQGGDDYGFRLIIELPRELDEETFKAKVKETTENWLRRRSCRLDDYVISC